MRSDAEAQRPQLTGASTDWMEPPPPQPPEVSGRPMLFQDAAGRRRWPERPLVGK